MILLPETAVKFNIGDVVFTTRDDVAVWSIDDDKLVDEKIVGRLDESAYGIVIKVAKLYKNVPSVYVDFGTTRGWVLHTDLRVLCT